MTNLEDPFNCPGPECHEGGFSGFTHFCDVLDVKDGEYGHAFAAWLSGTTSWDDKYERVDEGETTSAELVCFRCGAPATFHGKDDDGLKTHFWCLEHAPPHAECLPIEPYARTIRTSLGVCPECIDNPEADGNCECAEDMRVCCYCGRGPLNDSEYECGECRPKEKET